jgi:hypothetical protein
MITPEHIEEAISFERERIVAAITAAADELRAAELADAERMYYADPGSYTYRTAVRDGQRARAGAEVVELLCRHLGGSPAGSRVPDHIRRFWDDPEGF